MDKPLVKRSVEIAGHQTSITLEPEFWNALKDMAAAKSLSLPQLIARLDRQRETSTGVRVRNLSSHLRVAILLWLKGQVAG